jgi:hypothetical protein
MGPMTCLPITVMVSARLALVLFVSWSPI